MLRLPFIFRLPPEVFIVKSVAVPEFRVMLPLIVMEGVVPVGLKLKVAKLVAPLPRLMVPRFPFALLLTVKLEVVLAASVPNAELTVPFRVNENPVPSVNNPLFRASTPVPALPIVSEVPAVTPNELLIVRLEI